MPKTTVGQTLDFPKYEMHYAENNSWTNSKYPFAQASVDGWLIDKFDRLGIWECKTAHIVTSLVRAKWDGGIPQNYYCQCLFYMAVLEADFCVLKAQLKSEFDGEVRIDTRHYFFNGTAVFRRIITVNVCYIWQFLKQIFVF